MPKKTFKYLSLILILLAPLFLLAETSVAPFNIVNISDNSIQIRFELPAWSMERSEINNLSRVKIDDIPYLAIS